MSTAHHKYLTCNTTHPSRKVTPWSSQPQQPASGAARHTSSPPVPPTPLTVLPSARKPLRVTHPDVPSPPTPPRSSTPSSTPTGTHSPDSATDLSSVHTKETTEPQPATLTYRDSLLRFDREEMLAVEQTYSILDLDVENKRVKRLQDCRTTAYFAVHEKTNQVAVLSSSCKLKWCPMCAKARSALITRGATNWLQSAKSPKLLTLTLRHSKAPLRHQLNLLYQSFRQLKQRSLFDKKVRGGIWFFQVKWSPQNQEWHPHLHCLIDSKYIPQSALSALWLKITHHSKVVDIRQVKDKRSAAAYVARYSARPALLASLPYERRVEIVTDLHGRRLVGTFGTARLVRLRPNTASNTGPWLTLGTWKRISDPAGTDRLSLAVLKAWRERTSLSPSLTKSWWDRENQSRMSEHVMTSPTDPQYSFSDLHPPPTQPAALSSP